MAFFVEVRVLCHGSHVALMLLRRRVLHYVFVCRCRGRRFNSNRMDLSLLGHQLRLSLFTCASQAATKLPAICDPQRNAVNASPGTDAASQGPAALQQTSKACPLGGLHVSSAHDAGAHTPLLPFSSFVAFVSLLIAHLSKW